MPIQTVITAASTRGSGLLSSGVAKTTFRPEGLIKRGLGSRISVTMREGEKATGPPNTGMEPTPLSGEQDRGDFEGWIRPTCFPDLCVRRGSCPSRFGGSPS